MALLDGKKLAASIRKEVKARVSAFVSQYERAPGLTVVLVGDDPASQIYVKNKGRACKKTGIISDEHRLPAETGQEELLGLIEVLNKDDKVDGILVQLPVPKHIDPEAIIQAIHPSKDVDGLHPENVGALVAGKIALRSCTPLGCMRLLDEAGVDLVGANAVVIGRSVLVGKPVAMMLLERHATVTMCHSRTKKLAHIIQEADVIIAAVGAPELIKGEWVKRGAAVIDVGVSSVDGELVGDVDLERAIGVASLITPHRRGVGPMTITMLLHNTLIAYRSRISR